MKKCFIGLGLIFSVITNAATPIDGWYSSLFGGYTYIPNNLNKHVNGQLWTDARYTSGYDLGGSLGYKSNPMRYEGEFSYINAELSHFKKHKKTLSKNVDGDNNAFLAMANAYYDFNGFVAAINPFIGGGLGFAYVNGKFMNTNFHLKRVLKYTGSNTVFAYQGTAGLTYNFAENYAINVAYKYLATQKIQAFDKIFQAHIGNVGIIYRFDEPIYK